MAEKKNYVLRKGGNDTDHIFTGTAPRQAALKAATRGHKNIKLRERGRRLKNGKYPVHVFNGEVKKVPAPSNAPDWLPDMVRKPNVSKKGMEYLNSL